MLKIAVLDDQQQYLTEIEHITEKFMSLNGVEYELRKYIRSQDLLDDLDDRETFDIYLLDVEMPEYSGIEVARRIRKEHADPAIIYITNYIGYAVEGYEVNAYRYIPKKQLEKKLLEAYKALYIQIVDRGRAFYTIEKNHHFERIPYHEIYYLKKEGKYVLIIHERGQSRVRKTLADVLDEFQNNSNFMVIDRSCAVNIAHIMSLKNNQAFLRDGTILPVSRLRVEQVVKRLGNYWR